MSDSTDGTSHVETFPGGITETDGQVPFFLKVTYVFFVVFALSYWFLYSAGDGSVLVQQLNKATSLGMP
jgi:hypothetical protein